MMTTGRMRSGSVTVPMQGTIVKVLVEVGQQVEAGQAVVVLEAMKMENELRALIAGKVESVHVKPGDAVEGSALLVRLACARTLALEARTSRLKTRRHVRRCGR